MVYNKQFFFENLIHPWKTLEELLDSKEMTQKELSQRIGVTPKHITSIINWKNWISPELALKLEKVFWVSAWFWNNLQKSYEEDKIKLEEENILEEEKEQVSKYTAYKNLVKLWFVKNTRNKVERLQELLVFFWVSFLWALKKLSWMETQFAFRKYEKFDFSEENFRAWIRAWEIFAEKIEVEEFSKKKLKEIIPEIKKMTFEEKVDIKKLQDLFSSCWVKFIFVEGFEKVPVVWITRKYRWVPIIQISDRWKKHDIFFFTLLHEIGHIILHLSTKDDIFIDLEKGWISQIEQEADAFAEKYLNDEVDKSILAWRIGHEIWNWAEMSKHRRKLEVIV